ARRHLDMNDVASLVVIIQNRCPGGAAVGALHHVALLNEPPAGVVLPAEQLVDAGPQPAPLLDPAVLQVIGILHGSPGLVADFDQTVSLVIFKADHMQRAGHTGLGLEVEIPALLDAVAGDIVFVLGQLVLRLAVCTVLAWLAFLGQPAGIVVSIQRADAFCIRFAGEITDGVDQFDDVAAEVMNITFLYRAVRRVHLDQPVYFIVLVGIAHPIVPFGIVIHGLDFLEDTAHGVVEDTLDALVRVDDPDLIVVGIVFAADAFAVVGLEIIGVGMDLLDHILGSIPQGGPNVAQCVDPQDLLVHLIVDLTGARTVSQGGIVLVGPDDLDQVAEQVKEIFGGVLQRICDLAAAVPVVVGIACPTLVGDNGHAAAGLVIVVVDTGLIGAGDKVRVREIAVIGIDPFSAARGADRRDPGLGIVGDLCSLARGFVYCVCELDQIAVLVVLVCFVPPGIIPLPGHVAHCIIGELGDQAVGQFLIHQQALLIESLVHLMAAAVGDEDLVLLFVVGIAFL